jgi:hypothetical protein
MSDYDIPELPSDEELGISDEDREAYADQLGDDRPELSDEEMRALLGDVPGRGAAGASGAKPAPKAKGARKAAKAARKAEKERKKEEKRRTKEKQRAAKAAAKNDAGHGDAAESDSERAARIARAAASTEPAPPGGADTSPPPGPPGGREPPPPIADDTPRRRWRGAVTLAFLLVVAWVASSRTLIPGPAPANAPDTAFSSARAMSTLIEIATRAHPTGSPDHARVRELLVDRLRSLGLEPEVQTTTSLLQEGPRARTATVRNIVARIPGTDPTGALLMTAHYDGRGISVAASDDGVGVVTIVEAVRALLTAGPPRNDVIVLFSDAEELGLLGARAFVREHPWFDDVSLVLSFEMRGSGGPSIMFETNELNGWVVRAMKEFDPSPFANSMSTEVYRRMPRDTDFSPLRDAGKQGLNYAAIDNAHVYHQTYDRPEALSESTLQHHGIHALAAARYLSQADLSSVNADDVVYFSVPFVGLIVYDGMWAWGISLLVMLLLVGAFFAARRTGARPGRMGIGAGVAIVTAALVFGAAFAMVEWLPRFHPEAGSLHGSLFHSEGWYMLALVGIAFAAVTSVHPIARRWITTAELGFGAALVPALSAVVAGFAAPLAAMNLQWPTIAGLLSITLFALLRSRAGGLLGWAIALLLAAPVLLFFVPLIELVWLAFSIRIGAWLSVLMVVALFLCLPAVDGLRHPNAWWAPLTGLAVTGVTLGLGLLSARSTDTRPAPSTLIYAYEHGTGAAVWATDPTADSVDAAATAWAAQRAGGAFDGTHDLSRFGYLSGETPTVAAPVVAAQPPEVVLTRDTVDGATRRVTLEVRSRIGAEQMGFAYDDRGDTRLLTINGLSLDDPAALEWVDHWGVPDPAVVLELEMPAGQPIGLHVIEHLLRPEELVGAAAFERPPNLAPDVTRMSDRAMFRYSVGAFADPRHAIELPEAAPSTGRGPSEGAPDPDAAGPDSGTVSSDSTTARDTVRVDTTTVPDTTAVPDTTTTPDTTAAPRDTTGASTDTLIPSDNLAITPDTTSSSPDTTTVSRRPG